MSAQNAVISKFTIGRMIKSGIAIVGGNLKPNGIVNGRRISKKNIEKSRFFAENGEPHRADVHTSSGVTIEFQNSPISIEELTSRENFYKKLIWVVNGKKFKERIELLHFIPNPDHPLLYSLRIETTGNPKYGTKRGLAFIGLGLSLDGQFEEDRLFGLHHKELEGIKGLFTGIEQKYWLFEWKHKHKAWLNCSAPVFMDFGGNYLHLIKRRKHPKDPKLYFQVFEKAEFIKKYSE